MLEFLANREAFTVDIYGENLFSNVRVLAWDAVGIVVETNNPSCIPWTSISRIVIHEQ